VVWARVRGGPVASGAGGASTNLKKGAGGRSLPLRFALPAVQRAPCFAAPRTSSESPRQTEPRTAVRTTDRLGAGGASAQHLCCLLPLCRGCCSKSIESQVVTAFNELLRALLLVVGLPKFTLDRTAFETMPPQFQLSIHTSTIHHYNLRRNSIMCQRKSSN
jgi:hypothetical protein